MDLILVYQTTCFFEEPRHLLSVKTVVCHRVFRGILRADHIRVVILVRVERPVDNDDPAAWSKQADQAAKHGQGIRDVVQRHAHNSQIEVSKIVGADCRALGLHQIALNSPHLLGFEAQLSSILVVKLHHASRYIDAANLIYEGV